MSVSILILALNEEINLPDCLKSIAWSDDIVVFDSYSIDRTIEISGVHGARVVQRAFDNYAAQRNAALNEVTFRNPWVLMLDADERVTPALREEICQVVADANDSDTMFRVRRKDMFLGRWLRYSSGYPTWFGRLFRVGKVWVEREINEEYHTDGRTRFLKEHLLHLPFNRGLVHWFDRHNRYSSMEAIALLEETRGPLSFGCLLSSDPTLRRKVLKQLAYRLPARPLFVFCYLYLVRLGLLDGRAGISYCFLRACYELMIDLKVTELKRRSKGLAV